jgi:hypothetical protein
MSNLDKLNENNVLLILQKLDVFPPIVANQKFNYKSIFAALFAKQS